VLALKPIREIMANRIGGPMFGLGLGELVIVLLILLIVFSRRLPDLGDSVGKGIRRFRRSLKESEEIDITPDEATSKDKPAKNTP
jgi:sec-independent protein translocase protein TatA